MTNTRPFIISEYTNGSKRPNSYHINRTVEFIARFDEYCLEHGIVIPELEQAEPEEVREYKRRTPAKRKKK